VRRAAQTRAPDRSDRRAAGGTLTAGARHRVDPAAPRGPRSPATGRILALDGLRGCAFLSIFFVHITLPAGYEQSHPLLTAIKEVGWIGVPIYFFLSGYLITELALREGNRFSLRRFYLRRAIRVWPLHFAAIGVALLAWHVPLLREARVGADPRWIWPLLTFTLNFSLRGHWSEWHSLGAIALFWTLAVEEQFYFFWGPVLRWATRRAMLVICVVLIATSLVTRFVLPLDGKPFLAYRMHSLIDLGSIMLGASFAFRGLRTYRLTRRATRIGYGLAGAALLVIAVLEWPLPADTFHAGVLVTAVDLVALALLVLAVCGEGVPRRVLETRPLRWLGEMSYPGYVIHLNVFWFYYATVDRWWPANVLDRRSLLAILVDAAIVLGVTLPASRAWYALEAPFRRARERLRTPPAVMATSRHDEPLVDARPRDDRRQSTASRSPLPDVPRLD
jgi:peptidoglycan/LPS O-acetylase OafA/YrhL